MKEFGAMCINNFFTVKEEKEFLNYLMEQNLQETVRNDLDDS